MRQLGSFADSKTAQLLADYLLTQQIDTRVDREAEAWLVWVCDEDRLAEAKKALAEFQADPGAERYLKAPREAALLRKQTEVAEQVPAFGKEPAREARFSSITMILFAACAIIALITNFGGYGFGLIARRADIDPGPVVKALVFASYQMVERPSGEVVEWAPEILSGQIWRIVTPIFIHFSVWHFLLNMLALNFYGRDIEEKRGPWIFLILVLGSAILSNLAQFFIGGSHWTWDRGFSFHLQYFGGMSGVIYALFGYVWMKVLCEPELGFEVSYTNWLLMLVWFVACWTGLLGPIANVAHTVGLVVGMLFGFSPAAWRAVRQRWR